MRLHVTRIADGPGPNEVVIEVITSTGKTEQVIIDVSTLEENMIEVGYPIHRSDDQALVELPRESTSGQWRLWVPSASVA